MSRPQIQTNKSFTLLEVLLSVSIISIIMGCVYGVFWGGLKMNERSREGGQVYREMRWSLNLLKKDLENMAAYDFSNSYPDLTAVSGSSSELALLSSDEDGLKVIQYYLLSEEEGQIHRVTIGQTYKKNVTVTQTQNTSTRTQLLMRKETPFVDYLSQQSAHSDPEIISDKIKENSLKFEYAFYEDANSAVLSWTDEWKKSERPRAVRVTLDFVLEENANVSIPVVQQIYVPTGS